MRNGKFGRGALMVAAAMGGFCLPAMAAAQEPRQVYSIEAVSLSEALTAVSRQSGVEVIFASDAVAGKRVRPLNGSYSAREAIDRLLAGTDLVAEYRDGGFVVRGRAQASAGTSSAQDGSADIIVTGSHLRGVAGTSPVLSTPREDIQNQGIYELGEFARSVPQNFSGGQNPGIVGSAGGNENVNSSTALNLRGLGPDATLTLINGHRVAYDGAAQGVDISAVPLDAVERIELVTDGSSALYGSDAVGGVANIILRREFEGAKLTGRLGAATNGGDVQQQYSVVTGSKWGSGGVAGIAEFNHSTAITARQRSYASSLDDSATLYPSMRQFSGVIAGHQSLSDYLTLEVDAQFSDRKSDLSSPTVANSSARTNGVVSDYHVQFFALSPRLKLDIDGGWIGTLTGSFSKNDTDNRLANYVAGSESARIRSAYRNRLGSVEIGLEGPLAETSAGKIRVAVGGGLRSTGLNANVRVVSGRLPGSTPQVFDGSRDAYFGYGELSVPIVGEGNALPLLKELSLLGAARYESYEGIGHVTTPKLGVVFSPVYGLRVKGSWGRSFKAPTLYQQFGARQGFLLPGFIFQSPQTVGRTVLLLQGSNPSLAPERATTWTGTIEIEPAFLDGLHLEVSYFNVKYRERITQPFTNILGAFRSDALADLIALNPSAGSVNEIAAGLTTGVTNQSGALFDPAQVAAIIDNRFQNAASQAVQGVDISVRQKITLGRRDTLMLTGNASYLESKQRLSAGQPLVLRAGRTFNPPHWRARGTMSWARDNVTLTGVASYIGGTLDDRFTPNENVDPYFAIDLSARVRLIDQSGPFSGVEVALTIANLFDEDPSRVRTTSVLSPPYDSSNYPSIGRAATLSISKSF